MNCGGDTERQVVYYSPLLYCPLDSARHALERLRGLLNNVYAGKNVDMKSLMQLKHGGGQIEQSRSGTERLFIALILFFACLFSGALASQRSFHTLFFAGLQVEGVTLDLLDDVFLLHLALEAA
jgi:hypothetical protein